MVQPVGDSTAQQLDQHTQTEIDLGLASWVHVGHTRMANVLSPPLHDPDFYWILKISVTNACLSLTFSLAWCLGKNKEIVLCSRESPLGTQHVTVWYQYWQGILPVVPPNLSFHPEFYPSSSFLQWNCGAIIWEISFLVILKKKKKVSSHLFLLPRGLLPIV